MTDGAPRSRALVEVHRTAGGGLEVRVQALSPPKELGRVPLAELAVLLEALAEDADG